MMVLAFVAGGIYVVGIGVIAIAHFPLLGFANTSDSDLIKACLTAILWPVAIPVRLAYWRLRNRNNGQG